MPNSFAFKVPKYIKRYHHLSTLCQGTTGTLPHVLNIYLTRFHPIFCGENVKKERKSPQVHPFILSPLVSKAEVGGATPQRRPGRCVASTAAARDYQLHLSRGETRCGQRRSGERPLCKRLVREGVRVGNEGSEP